MLKLRVAHSPGESRVALLRNDVLSEYLIHRPGASDGHGDLHWARLVARVPAMAGVFVAMAGTEGFLPDTGGGVEAGVGDHLAVRVTRAAQGRKGPRVTARLSDAERALGLPGPVRLLAPGPTPIEELRAAYPDAGFDEDGFDTNLEGEIAALGDAAIALPGGLRGTIVPTDALTAIDLDSFAATADRTPKIMGQFAANRAALPELARQIRLRNLAGAILLDFCGIASRKRPGLRDPLEAALLVDRTHPRLLGFTALGFAEILRPRLRPPLHERLAGPHAAGLAALRQVAGEAARRPAGRLALRAAPTVIAALDADRPALAALGHGMTHRLVLRSDPTLPGTNWKIEDANV